MIEEKDEEVKITSIDFSSTEYVERLIIIIQNKINDLERKCDRLQGYYYEQIDLGANPQHSQRLIAVDKNIQRIKGKDEAYIDMLLQFVKVKDKLINKQKKRKKSKENG